MKPLPEIVEQRSADSATRRTQLAGNLQAYIEENAPGTNTLNETLSGSIRACGVKEDTKSGKCPLLASPAQASFHGMEPNVPQVLEIELVNSHPTERLRLRMYPPGTPYFRSNIHDLLNGRPGLSPGLSCKVRLEFTPTETRYYADRLVIDTQLGRLIIPVHAYPVIGTEIPVPRRLDFGSTIVGREIVRRFNIPNTSASAAFEYQLRTLKPHSDYTFLVPMDGVIQPLETLAVGIAFCPRRAVTAEMVFEVDIAQFNFDPIRCTCVGDSVVFEDGYAGDALADRFDDSVSISRVPEQDSGEDANAVGDRTLSHSLNTTKMSTKTKTAAAAKAESVKGALGMTDQELFSATAMKKVLLHKEKIRLDSSGVSNGGDVKDTAGEAKRARARAIHTFDKEFGAIETAEKDKALKQRPCFGTEGLSKDEVEEEKERRDREKAETEHREFVERYGWNDSRPVYDFQERRPERISPGVLDTLRATAFEHGEEDPWQSRVALLTSLVEAGRRQLISQRILCRLNAVRAALNEKSSSTSSTSSPSATAKVLRPLNNVHIVKETPKYDHQLRRGRIAVQRMYKDGRAVSTDTVEEILPSSQAMAALPEPFEDWDYLRLNAPMNYKHEYRHDLLGVPVHSAYMAESEELFKTLQSGCSQELALVTPVLQALDIDQQQVTGKTAAESCKETAMIPPRRKHPPPMLGLGSAIERSTNVPFSHPMPQPSYIRQWLEHMKELESVRTPFCMREETADLRDMALNSVHAGISRGTFVLNAPHAAIIPGFEDIRGERERERERDGGGERGSSLMYMSGPREEDVMSDSDDEDDEIVDDEVEAVVEGTGADTKDPYDFGLEAPSDDLLLRRFGLKAKFPVQTPTDETSTTANNNNTTTNNTTTGNTTTATTTGVTHTNASSTGDVEDDEELLEPSKTVEMISRWMESKREVMEERLAKLEAMRDEYNALVMDPTNRVYWPDS